MSASKGNLKDLSIQEIDDLIREKATSLRQTEEKISRNGDKMANSTLRRRENMKSLVLNFSPKINRSEIKIKNYKSDILKNEENQNSNLTQNRNQKKFYTAKEANTNISHHRIPSNGENMLLAGTLLEQLTGVSNNKENDAIKPNGRVPRDSRRSRRTEHRSISVRRRGNSIDFASNKTDKKAIGQALQALQKRNQEVEILLKKLQEENEGLRKDFEEKKIEMKDLEDKMTLNLREAKEETTQTRIEVKLQEDKNHELSEKIKEKDAVIQIREKEISRLKTKSSKVVHDKDEVITEEEKKVSELNEIIDQNSKFIEARNNEITSMKKEISEYQQALKASYEKYQNTEFELSNKIYSLESDLHRVKNDFTELQNRSQNVIQRTKRDKEILEKRLKNIKNKHGESKAGYETRLEKLKEEISELENEAGYLRKTNKNLEKMLSKEKSGKKIESKGQRDLTNVVNLSIELVDDILRACRGQKNLGHVFKNFQQRRKQVEKKYKSYRSNQASYLRSGKGRKKSLLRKDVIATKKVTQLNYPRNGKRGTPQKKKRRSARNSSAKKSRRGSRKNTPKKRKKSRSRSRRSSIKSVRSKKSRNSKRKSRKNSVSSKRPNFINKTEFENLDSENQRNFATVTDISNSEISDFSDNVHNKTVNYFNAQPLYLSTARHSNHSTHQSHQNNHIQLMDYNTIANDSLAYESSKNPIYHSNSQAGIHYSASTNPHNFSNDRSNNTFENVKKLNFETIPNSVKKSSIVSYNLSGFTPSQQNSIQSQELTLQQGTKSLIKKNLFNHMIEEESTNRMLSSAQSDAGKTRTEIRKEIRAMEDSMIKMKKVYKQKLGIDTTGMSADDISLLRQELSSIMTDIELRGDELLQKRKFMRNMGK